MLHRCALPTDNASHGLTLTSVLCPAKKFTENRRGRKRGKMIIVLYSNYLHGSNSVLRNRHYRYPGQDSGNPVYESHVRPAGHPSNHPPPAGNTPTRIFTIPFSASPRSMERHFGGRKRRLGDSSITTRLGKGQQIGRNIPANRPKPFHPAQPISLQTEFPNYITTNLPKFYCSNIRQHECQRHRKNGLGIFNRDNFE